MIGPTATPTPEIPATSDRAAPLGRGEHVGEDRQRRRHDERGAEPGSRGRDEDPGGTGERGRERPRGEDHEPDENAGLRP